MIANVFRPKIEPEVLTNEYLLFEERLRLAQFMIVPPASDQPPFLDERHNRIYFAMRRSIKNSPVWLTCEGVMEKLKDGGELEPGFEKYVRSIIGGIPRH
jgi:hypothetical protein